MQCSTPAISYSVSTMLTSTSRTGGDGGCRAVAVAVVLAVLCALLLLPVPTNACSCMPMHPQTHYCSADYGRCKNPRQDEPDCGMRRAQ